MHKINIKHINQKLILENIFNKKEISRSELSKILKISKSTVTENISYLLKTNIIKEVGKGISMPLGGKKPILLSFNNDYAKIIAIDLSFAEPIFVLANIGGDILYETTINISKNLKYNQRLKLIINSVEKILLKNNLQIDDIEVISISSPGIYSPQNKLFIANKQFEEWHIDKLHEDLINYFNIKIIISNDVNSAALGETTNGVAINKKNVLFIGCGLGIGAGIIVDGKLHKGFKCSAGAISNFKLDCNDKNIEDTLENKINIIALINKYKNENIPDETMSYFKSQNKTKKNCNFKDIVNLYKIKDKYTMDNIYTISEILAHTIHNILCIVNSEIVIIGGDYSIFSSEMVNTINKIIKNVYYYPIEISSSKLGKYSGIYGLLSVSRDYIFDKVCCFDNNK